MVGFLIFWESVLDVIEFITYSFFKGLAHSLIFELSLWFYLNESFFFHKNVQYTRRALTTPEFRYCSHNA